MENNENFVEQTENVETVTTEENAGVQTERTYTQAELDEIVGKRLARNTAKITKQFESKYGDLEDVLKVGLGVGSVEEAREGLRSFYAQKGKPVPQKPSYSDKDIEILAKAEADDIIRAGYEDVVEEVDRLSEVGFENLTSREKAVFHTLAEYRQKTERGRELSSIGVTEDVYESEEFKSFAKQFNSNTPIKDVFDIYRKTQPQKEIRTMGSMKSTPASDSGVKEFYTVEEARKFTKADYDNNPALFAAVERSMQKWK